ncbi:MAG: aspartate kinase [Firmicutes bacterium]|nr:aspartate kinase [Bacillota bacterium]
MKTTVLKFGGTSLADSNQIKKAADIVKSDPSRRFVVASAPGKRFDDDIKVTDLLLDCYNKASQGADFEESLMEVKVRFEEIIGDLDITFDIEPEIDLIRRNLKNYPSRSYAASRGEYLNSKILAAYLGYNFVDPYYCIKFKAGGELDSKATYSALIRTLSDLPNAVIAGFYGSGPDGNIITFSRGGSDITGSLVAKAVGADLYENWTDVSGLLAADPRIIKDPRVVEYISYRELRTLSYMGATVLHADALLPVNQAEIPVNIRNTNRPQDPGTMIVSDLPKEREKHTITGVAGRKGLSVIQVEKIMVSDGAGFTAIILDIFKNLGVPFEQCLTGIDTVTLIVRSDYFSKYKDELLKAIEEQLEPDLLLVRENLAMIAVVGESDADYQGSTVAILGAVSDKGIELNTINQGGGSLNLIIGVNETDYEEAIKAIYNSIQR